MLRLLKALFDRPLAIGTMLQKRYRLTSYVGRGSYGMVYLAYDQDTEQVVIVKQHRERKGKYSQDMLKREAHTLSMLDHPSIPTCLGFFQEGQTYFLVMDYIEGSNFEDLVLHDGREYDEKESLQILLKVVNVVRYLHENRLIHRDLRLPNIIEKDKRVFIIDFGLAVFHQDQEETTLQEKNYFREKSFKSDFYALGHFLLFMLYSNFEPTSKKERSWEEELDVSEGTKNMITKLLRIERGYEDILEISKDVEFALKQLNFSPKGE